jgi:hypothetical protein
MPSVTQGINCPLFPILSFRPVLLIVEEGDQIPSVTQTIHCLYLYLPSPSALPPTEEKDEMPSFIRCID